MASCEVAAETRDFDEVVCEAARRSGLPPRPGSDLIDEADLSRRQHVLGSFGRHCSIEHRHPEDSPPENTEYGDEIDEPLGGSQLELFGIAAG